LPWNGGGADVYILHGDLLVLFVGFLIQGQRASKWGRAEIGSVVGTETQIAAATIFLLVVVVLGLLIRRLLEELSGWPNVAWLAGAFITFGLALLAGWLIERYVAGRTRAR
jgi:carbon starvation protein CstA